MALKSLISSSKKNKSKSKFMSFMPQLCDIVEDETLEPALPTTSIMSIKLQNKKLNPKALTFVPSSKENTTKTPKLQSKILHKYIPAHKPRAKLNIYISKGITKQMLSILHESFPGTSTLYNYLDVSTTFQINNGQMNIFQTCNTDNAKVILANWDLHKKGTQEILYGVIVPNDGDKIKKCDNNKWLWKLEECLTVKEIRNKYKININDLPKSSRSMKNGLNYQLSEEQKQFIDHPLNKDILYGINWNNINQIAAQSRKKKKAKDTGNIVKISNKDWINECYKSWDDIKELIPIVVYEGTKYWIEWIKMIYLEEYKSHVGMSFKRENVNGKYVWRIQAIYFDKNDIINKYRLLNESKSSTKEYSELLDKCQISATKMRWYNTVPV